MIRVGSAVRWKWGSGHGEGKVVETFTTRVTRTLEGSAITRNATPEEPAYLIETDDGSRVLKSSSEIERAPDR